MRSFPSRDYSDQAHLSDQQLLLALEYDRAQGERTQDPAGHAQIHLAACAACRERQNELAETLSGFSLAYRSALADSLPPIETSEAILRARLQQPSARPVAPALAFATAAVIALAAIGVTLIATQTRDRLSNEFAPRAALTPGATRPLNRQQVCSASPGGRVNNIASPVAQRIFSEYGIHDPRPRAYEVDYLIPPDLGGTEDPRNLWPQPYASGVWNSRVKDALEDRLRMLVCAGQLDLATAQKDLAHDWIAAYKKYFRTQQPLVSHAAFIKDRPWE